MSNIDFELLKTLITARGVSGFEDPVKSVIINFLENFNVKYFEDSLGNIIVEIGEGDVISLVCAHMDEVGLLVTNVEHDDKIRFRKVGGIDDRVLVNQIVEIYNDSNVIKGVICIQPPHLQLKRDLQVVPWYDLYIDVGVDSKEDVKNMGIEPPCPACLHKIFEILNRGKVVVGRGIDDRVGCYTLLKLVERFSREGYRYGKIIFAWTVQEEIGLRGAKALTQIIKPDYIIVGDTVSCCNPIITGNMKLGNGPVLRLIDNECIASFKFAKFVIELCKKYNLPIQIYTAGGTTDALELQEINVHVLPIGIPLKYSHSPVELACIKDIEYTLELLRYIIENIPQANF